MGGRRILSKKSINQALESQAIYDSMETQEEVDAYEKHRDGMYRAMAVRETYSKGPIGKALACRATKTMKKRTEKKSKQRARKSQSLANILNELSRNSPLSPPADRDDDEVGTQALSS